MKKQLGFTLIELLVVISIIGVLAGLLLVNFVGVRGRAKDAQIKNDLRQVKAALRLYYNDYQVYPDAIPAGSFEVAGVSYMKEVPADFTYYSNNDETFLLRAVLSNPSDETIASSRVQCSSEITEYNITPAAGEYFVCQD